MRALRSKRNAESILTEIRTALAEDAPGKDVIGVLFRTDLSPIEGGYLSSEGEVLCADGTFTVINFAEPLDDLLVSEYGIRGEDFGLAVDLRDNTFDECDKSYLVVYAHFGQGWGPITESSTPRRARYDHRPCHSR